MLSSDSRQLIPELKRVVIKVGTRVLVNERGGLDEQRLTAIVDQIARLRAAGREVVLVTSGSIGAGLTALGLRRRPRTLPDLQMVAAVGQSKLMARYDEAFARRGIVAGQVLLTHDGLRDRVRHLNARNTMMSLLRHGIVPVVNENDVVAVEEIRFGDNDYLGALVTMLVNAELLILLTTTNGFRRTTVGTRTSRVAHLTAVTAADLDQTHGKGGALSTGGMRTKLEAAQCVVDVGGAAMVADGRQPDTLDRIFAGDDVGTVIGVPKRLDRQATLASKKRWIAFFQRPKGAVVIDHGAADALRVKGKSLLPIGICSVEGQFDIGSMVNIKSIDGEMIGRGLVEYASTDIDCIKGKRTETIAKILVGKIQGERSYEEVIHRDNMVLLAASSELFNTKDAQKTAQKQSKRKKSR